jgi:hypothetical protein
MDYKDVTAILLKIVGAALVFWYVALLPSTIFGALGAKTLGQALGLAIFPGVLPLLLGIFLFMFPATVSNKLIDGSKLAPTTKGFREFEVFALRAVGVFFVFRALVDLAYHLAKVFMTNSIYDAYGTSRPPTPWTLESAAGVIATVIELGLAIWLAIGTQGLVRLLDRTRGREQDL